MVPHAHPQFEARGAARPIPSGFAHRDAVPTGGGMLSPEYALTCSLPDEGQPLGKVACDVECALDPVRGAVGLLGAVCRWVAEADGRPTPLTPFLREVITLNVVHRAWADPGFRRELSEWICIGPALDQSGQSGEFDIDRPESVINSLPADKYLALVLDLFTLMPVVTGVRDLAERSHGNRGHESPARRDDSAPGFVRREERLSFPVWPDGWESE
jgi:hypothetical protein